MRSLFLFRRDLRLDDNTALIAASEKSDEIVAAFIFDPRQASSDGNEYFSANAFQFLIESLDDLGRQIHARDGRLYLFEGTAEEVVRRLLEHENFGSVYFNRDYTPFSRARDERIRKVCEDHGVRVESFDDTLLTRPGEVCTNDGSTYQVYSYFAHKARRSEPPRPRRLGTSSFYRGQVRGSATKDLLSERLLGSNPEIHVRGGRDQGLELLAKVSALTDYESTRNDPFDETGTTSLSAFHKFGCVSIRETFWTVKDELGGTHPLIGELYWRDFFTHLAAAHPRVFGESFRKEFDAIRWKNDERDFRAWKEGRTGFPIVDAGMRQLLRTGFMHNRVRMIVASFLVKDLQIDWRWGERHFARHLVDYDPAVNNGNWQWAASTGADAQPYFRIFNPWTQAKKFDPEAIYIGRWVDELQKLEPRAIHNLWKEHPAGLDYPRPVVDHKVEAARAQRMFEKAR